MRYDNSSNNNIVPIPLNTTTEAPPPSTLHSREHADHDDVDDDEESAPSAAAAPQPPLNTTTETPPPPTTTLPSRDDDDDEEAATSAAAAAVPPPQPQSEVTNNNNIATTTTTTTTTIEEEIRNGRLPLFLIQQDDDDDMTVKTVQLDDDGNEVEPNPQDQTTRQQRITIPSQYIAAAVAAGIIPRQGHSYFGIGCDMRRAVLIINVMNMTISICGILLVLWILSIDDDDDEYDNDNNGIENNNRTTNVILGQNQDDYYGQEYDTRDSLDTLDTSTSPSETSVLWGLGLAILFYSMGILGAWQYYALLVFVTGIWYCILMTMNLFTFNWIPLLWNLASVYPHWVLVVEFQRGILTPTTYPMEQHCCIGTGSS